MNTELAAHPGRRPRPHPGGRQRRGADGHRPGGPGQALGAGRAAQAARGPGRGHPEGGGRGAECHHPGHQGARWPTARGASPGPSARLGTRPSAWTSPRSSTRRRSGHLHIVTQTWQALEDIFVGMGYGVAEGPEIETDWYNFEALNIPDSHPARSMWDTLWVDIGRRRRPPHVAADPHVQRADPRDAGPGATDLRGGPRAHLPPGHHRRHPPAGLPPDRGPGGGQGHHAWPTWPGPSRPSPRPTSARSSSPGCARRTSRSPSRRPSSTSVRRVGTGWSSAAAAWSTPTSSATWASTPRSGPGFAFGFGIDRLAKVRYAVDDLREFITSDIRFLEQF